jgi:hypothetical protein
MASPQKSPKTGLAPSDLVAGASLDGLDRNLSILQRSRAGLPNGLSQALAIGRRKDPLESQGPRVDHISPNVDCRTKQVERSYHAITNKSSKGAPDL